MSEETTDVRMSPVFQAVREDALVVRLGDVSTRLERVEQVVGPFATCVAALNTVIAEPVVKGYRIPQVVALALLLLGVGGGLGALGIDPIELSAEARAWWYGEGCSDTP